MATITKAAMRPLHVGQRLGRGYKEGATQTFKAGDLLQPDTAAGKNRVKIADADETTILGTAAEDAAAVADTDISVYVARLGDEWIGNVNTTLDRSHQNVKYGIVKDSAGVWLIDISDTSAVRVKVLRLYDEHGDTNGRVVFTWLEAALVHGSA